MKVYNNNSSFRRCIDRAFNNIDEKDPAMVLFDAKKHHSKISMLFYAIKTFFHKLIKCGSVESLEYMRRDRIFTEITSVIVDMVEKMSNIILVDDTQEYLLHTNEKYGYSIMMKKDKDHIVFYQQKVINEKKVTFFDVPDKKEIFRINSNNFDSLKNKLLRVKCYIDNKLLDIEYMSNNKISIKQMSINRRSDIEFEKVPNINNFNTNKLSAKNLNGQLCNTIINELNGVSLELLKLRENVEKCCNLAIKEFADHCWDYLGDDFLEETNKLNKEMSFEGFVKNKLITNSSDENFFKDCMLTFYLQKVNSVLVDKIKGFHLNQSSNLSVIQEIQMKLDQWNFGESIGLNFRYIVAYYEVSSD